MSTLLIMGITLYIIYGISLTELINKMGKTQKKPKIGFISYLLSVVFTPLSVLIIFLFIGFINLPERLYK